MAVGGTLGLFLQGVGLARFVLLSYNIVVFHVVHTLHRICVRARHCLDFDFEYSVKFETKLTPFEVRKPTMPRTTLLNDLDEMFETRSILGFQH